MTAIFGTLAAAATATMLASASSQKFYTDDPVWVERDTQDASSMKPLEVNLFVDLAYNVIKGSGVDRLRVRAKNVNTVDEVPDSSWFTNRVGHAPLTAGGRRERPRHERRTGAGHVDDHLVEERRRHAGLHDQGRHRPALVPEVRPARLPGDVDGHRSRGHEADVGARLQRARRITSPTCAASSWSSATTAKFTPASGKTRAMRIDDLDNLLERANREADGSFRIVASKALRRQADRPHALRRHAPRRSQRHRAA